MIAMGDRNRENQTAVAISRIRGPSRRERRGRKPDRHFTVDRVHLQTFVSPALLVHLKRPELHVERLSLGPAPSFETTHARVGIDGRAGRHLLRKADRERVVLVAIAKAYEVLDTPKAHALPVLRVRERNEQQVVAVGAVT